MPYTEHYCGAEIVGIFRYLVETGVFSDEKRFHNESHNGHTGQSPNKMETSYDILDFVVVVN